MAQLDKRAEKQHLVKLISMWNIDHYDIFELSQPDENNQFHGVVRFFFQGGGANVITKCIRVASDATTMEVIDVLIEKFRPDMRMLQQCRYALYEVHVNGEERQLLEDEKPLWVQLNWGKDVREGRFLLKRVDEVTRKGATGDWPEQEKAGVDQGFKRKLSKREKKEKKKREKDKNKENLDKNDSSVAERLYSELPENSFTRSISNPEAVMRRRRQQKLEKKLQQMQGNDGTSDSGGILKIYGQAICPDVPYKTLLLSTSDRTNSVIREAMQKYGIEKEDPSRYCLAQMVLPPGRVEYHGGQIGEERILGEDECPLLIFAQFPKSRGQVIFQLRRGTDDGSQPAMKRPQKALSHNDLRYSQDTKNINADDLPFLLEMDPRGGKTKRHLLPLNVTEVGSERSVSNSSQYLQLLGNDIKPRHCVIAHTEGIVTVTPTSRDAETYVEHQRIYETTMLKDGMSVQFGKAFVFRFCDPRFDEPRRPGGHDRSMQKQPHPQFNERPQETNFDLDGHVETMPGNGSSPRSPGHTPHQEWEMHRRSAPDLHQGPPDIDPGDQLPASLEFRNNDESSMLRDVILSVNSRSVQFKLAPTYTLYLGIRHCLSPHIFPQLAPQQRVQRLADYVNRIARMVQKAIQEHHNDPTALAFWMANASEVLHFFKQDHDVQPFSHDAQELLAEAVQMAFQHLVRCLQVDLQRVMPAFLDASDLEDEEERKDTQYAKPSLTDVLNTLSAAMTLLRRCRVNAALTIQLFSQLFHFINMWLFNILVTEPQLQLYTRSWGIRLKRRLGRIEAWAEKQGLELAADCHLCRIIQAAHLLQTPKVSGDDITNISSTCFKLNSLQLHTLLVRYIPEPREPPVTRGFIEKVVTIGKNMADELTRTDGREVRLEEDQDLHLPFLLPEDGYSCDTIRGVPTGLPEFIKPMTAAGICQIVPNNGSSGSWTIYMGDGGGRSLENTPPKGPPPPQSVQPPNNLPRQPEVMVVIFKKVNGSMGLSIVAAMGEGQRERGIYIKSVVPNGAAALDGRLQAGDQLLEVDGRSLVGLSQDKAAELMTQTGHTVTLKVAKQGAIYHGLATLLSQPSPTMQRAASQPQNNRPGQQNNRIKLNHEEGPPPYTESPSDPRNNRTDPRLFNGMGGRGQESPRMPPHQAGRSPHMDQPHKDDRFRAPSMGNLNNGRFQPNQAPYDPSTHRRDPHEQDPRSKSTSNLNMDTSYDRPDPNVMKPAASVAALGPGPQGHPYPPNFGRKPNDYENQPQLNSLPPERNEPVKPVRSFTDINQNNMPTKPSHHHSQPYLHPQRPNDRSSVSSRTSSNSNRDNRPQSAYYDGQNREDFGQLRPKSDEITPNKIREWQEKLEDPRTQPFQNNLHPDHHSPHYNPGRDVNDARNIQDIPKLTVNNHPRQPNFYENTGPSQEAVPPFHQLPKQNDEKPKPPVKPKPAAKPTQPRVTPTEIPFTQVDNRLSQPQFFDPKSSQQESPNFYNPHAGKQPFQAPRQDPRASFGQKKISPERQPGPYGYRDQEDMPPPPQDEYAPELPPPPSNDDLHENSPPLPPPPSQEYVLEQQLQDEQRRMMNQMGQQRNFNSDPRFGGPAGYGRNEFDGQQGQFPDRNRAGQGHNDRQLPGNQQNNIHPNYQNISFGGPETQPPPIPQPPEHNVYEQYETQRSEMQPPHQAGAMHLTVKEEYNVGASPWDREEKEREQERYEEDMSKMREMEIAGLESKQYLNPQEQERLRKLRLEQEFQRRVKESMDKDEDEDSDTELAERLYSRERMIQAMKDDLDKSRNRLIDLERKRMIDEFEAEKDRLMRLERRLEQFEKDKEDHKLRIMKRQEKRQKDHEEQLRRQRELRDNQRQRFEEQKRLMMMEEEKMRQRREEELAKRKQYEREQLQEMQAAREIEEATLRAQIRQQEEEYSRKRLEKQKQLRLEQQREIRVSSERQRIESMQEQNRAPGFDHQPYANLPPTQPNRDVPQPPERNSSFNMIQRGSMRNSDYQGTNFRDQPQPVRRMGPETTAPATMPVPKKSVSFNTQLEQLNTYSVGSVSGESHPSVSSYRSSQGSQSESADHQFMDHPGMAHESNDVFASPPQNNINHDITYIAGGTPNVVGAQEIYRDPRQRIAAQKAANSIKRPGAERMSFRDKMKYFATEAGEDTIKLKPKASKTLRTIESQLNGQ
ncbi:afadin-like [Haliotis rufescens]|uniref:afadin-like n=1 Tax=Haliotis rufescens TaxID=6454 RepID=UPI001EAFC518|nr:afadin-like [Haliotis rufescens]